MRGWMIAIPAVFALCSCAPVDKENPDETLETRVDHLVAVLASDNQEEREKAMAELRALAENPETGQKWLEGYLRKECAESGSPEVKRYLAEIIAKCLKSQLLLFRIEVDGRCGFIDRKGKVVIEPKFDEVGEFSDGLAFFRMGDGLAAIKGIINQEGKVVIRPNDKYIVTEGFSEGLAPVIGKKGSMQMGYINRKGEFAIKPQFERAGAFSGGLAPVRKNGKWGYINTSGKMVIHAQFEKGADTFCNGVARVRLQGREKAYIDRTGRIITKGEFTVMGDFASGVALIRRDGKYQFIDKTGKTVISPDYEDVGTFLGGLARVKASGKYGYIDMKGKLVIEPKYQNAGSFSDGLAVVQTNGKWGYIDKTGEFAIQPKFDEADDFQNGLASVRLDLEDKYTVGYVDKTGEFVWNSGLRDVGWQRVPPPKKQ